MNAPMTTARSSSAANAFRAKLSIILVTSAAFLFVPCCTTFVRRAWMHSPCLETSINRELFVELPTTLFLTGTCFGHQKTYTLYAASAKSKLFVAKKTTVYKNLTL
jgi:hypothetical protein